MTELAAELTEETTPMGEAEQASADKATTAAPNAEQENTADSEQAAEESSTTDIPTPTLKIRYNHRDVELNNDDAVKYAQLGRHYEDNVKSVMDGLEYLAAVEGKSVKDYVESLKSGRAERYRKELEQEFGEGNPRVEELVELKLKKDSDRYNQNLEDRKKNEESERKAFDEQIADGFAALQKEFPELSEFSQLPKSVKQAAFAGDDIVKAYLLYMHKNTQAANKEKENQEKNKAQSQGSAATLSREESFNDAFSQGLWN